MLGLKEQSIHFEDFQSLIRQDYRDDFTIATQKLFSRQLFNQTLPLCLPQQDVWVDIRARIPHPNTGKIFGIDKKEDVRGINLYQNPNIPDGIKGSVRNREIVEFTHSFYHSKVRENNYYQTEKVWDKRRSILK